jgi:hypothetical protein
MMGVAILLMPLGLTGCDMGNDSENAGEQVEEGAEETGEAIEEGGEETGEAIGEGMDEANGNN